MRQYSFTEIVQKYNISICLKPELNGVCVHPQVQNEFSAGALPSKTMQRGHVALLEVML
jgi:hypothetical protein